ncbi:MAG: glycosyltransferase, partial [Muribaculaceae bacterium]|nr:glycosyltransferase [Muribaculaceae bacterium]
LGQRIFAQDYPAPLEVIVVNDGKNEEVKDAVTRLQTHHRNLHITFTPMQARNLSRKKLAVTVGIKAARHDTILLTDDSCMPSSDAWLKSMCVPLADPVTEIVIGHSRHTTDDSPSRTFSRAADATVYLSAALRGRPYRGDGHNLAYRRDTFFRNKGFSRSLNLHDGDDDIFINEVASQRNTAVALSTDAIISTDAGNSAKSYRQECIRRAFTARFLRKGARRFFGWSSTMMWLWVGLSAAACVISCPDMTGCAIVAAETLLLWIPIALTWHRTIKTLEGRTVPVISIPFRLMWRPMRNMRYRISSRRHRSDHYTWTK